MRFGLALGLCLWLAFGTARAEERRSTTPFPVLASVGVDRDSQSVGYPHQGTLRNGVKLKESKWLRYLPTYVRRGNFYGTSELIAALKRAAKGVAKRFRGAKLSVGELSKPRGGKISGHRSHQNGRDVDLAFYTIGPRGRAYQPSSFASFRRDGLAFSGRTPVRFDAPKNWELIKHLITDLDARVQYIFVARHIRQRLISYAKRAGTHKALLRRATKVLVEPRKGDKHRDHFHVRVYCSPEDRPQCADIGPIHAWYPGNWR